MLARNCQHVDDARFEILLPLVVAQGGLVADEQGTGQSRLLLRQCCSQHRGRPRASPGQKSGQRHAAFCPQPDSIDRLPYVEGRADALIAQIGGVIELAGIGGAGGEHELTGGVDACADEQPGSQSGHT